MFSGCFKYVQSQHGGAYRIFSDSNRFRPLDGDCELFSLVEPGEDLGSAKLPSERLPSSCFVIKDLLKLLRSSKLLFRIEPPVDLLRYSPVEHRRKASLWT